MSKMLTRRILSLISWITVEPVQVAFSWKKLLRFIFDFNVKMTLLFLWRILFQFLYCIMFSISGIVRDNLFIGKKIFLN